MKHLTDFEIEARAGFVVQLLTYLLPELPSLLGIKGTATRAKGDNHI
jgi:hypothetical protein